MMPSLRILFVDDEETFLDSTAELLRREGYACDCASTVPAAMALLEQNAYDLLIADVKMPGNADLEFARRLAAHNDGVPIILVTGFPSIDSAIQSVELPVVAYLVKPFEFQELVSKVQAVATRVAALRAVRGELARLQDYREGLTRAETHMRELPRAGQAASLEALAAMVLRNMVDSLSNLRQVADASAGDSAADTVHHWKLNMPADMRDVLREVVATLERTKSVFKSKELGELRRKLEHLLKT